MTEVEQKELAVLGLGEQFRRGQTPHWASVTIAKLQDGDSQCKPLAAASLLITARRQ